ncbi:MAG: effector-associated domain EAD1-containing protein [Chloroflexota bacterium]
MGKPRILLIDDDPDWRNVTLKSPLRRRGYEIETEDSSESAMDRIDESDTPFDLVVMNICLNQEKDGENDVSKITAEWTVLLDFVRETGAEVIVVSSENYPPPLSSFSLSRTAFRYYDVVDFIIKEEFDAREYRQSVEDAIEKSQARRQVLFAQRNGIANPVDWDNLTGQQIGEFQNALLRAFPNRSDLEQMLTIKMNASLDQIVEQGNLEKNVYDLLIWAKAQGFVEKLYRSAVAEVPGNPMLQTLEERLSKGDIDAV